MTLSYCSVTNNKQTNNLWKHCWKIVTSVSKIRVRTILYWRNVCRLIVRNINGTVIVWSCHHHLHPAAARSARSSSSRSLLSESLFFLRRSSVLMVWILSWVHLEGLFAMMVVAVLWAPRLPNSMDHGIKVYLGRTYSLSSSPQPPSVSEQAAAAKFSLRFELHNSLLTPSAMAAVSVRAPVCYSL